MKALFLLFGIRSPRRLAILLSVLAASAGGLAASPDQAAVESARRSAIGSPPPGSAVANGDVLDNLVHILKYGEVVGGFRPTKGDAVIALGLVGDESAVPVLVEHLENEPNQHLRMQIARTLGWIGSAKAVPALERALRDSYPYTRNQAAIALKTITGRDYEYDRTGLPVLSRSVEPRPAATPAR